MSARSITQITGHTRVLGILADPIAHVKAPPGINAICERRGRDAVMVPFQVAPDRLAAFADSLRTLKSFDGAIITVPHKAAMVAHCDEVSARAQAMGAVNVIRRTAGNRLQGDMLDGAGFVAGILGAGVALKGRRIYLAGAGGAASAIGFALAAEGVSHLTIANRTRAKAQDLCDRIAAMHPGVSISPGSEDPSGHDIVVNGTSLGMKPDDPLPLDATRLSASMVVAEIIMQPEITPLLARAREAGCHIHLGRPMLEHQLELMADFFGI